MKTCHFAQHYDLFCILFLSLYPPVYFEQLMYSSMFFVIVTCVLNKEKKNRFRSLNLDNHRPLVVGSDPEGRSIRVIWSADLNGSSAAVPCGSSASELSQTRLVLTEMCPLLPFYTFVG